LDPPAASTRPVLQYLYEKRAHAFSCSEGKHRIALQMRNDGSFKHSVELWAQIIEQQPAQPEWCVQAVPTCPRSCQPALMHLARTTIACLNPSFVA
jgi:hypothetical protein